jgi:parallel beta-helix repeat protein
VFAFNNQEHFAIEGDFAGAAGAKIFASTDVTARKNEFAANYSTGLWFDGSCFACKLIRNHFSDNKLAGVHVEESAQVMIAGNQAEQNAGAGICISNSSDIRVYNNRLIDNDPNIAVQDDSRVNSNPEEKGRGITYITGGVHLFNNVLAMQRGRGLLLWVRDYNSLPRRSAAQMFDGCDYNCWQHPENRNSTLVEWWGKSGRSVFNDLKRFHADTGFEAHGFESPVSSDQSPIKTARGHELPADIARELDACSAATEPTDKRNISLDHEVN